MKTIKPLVLCACLLGLAVTINARTGTGMRTLSEIPGRSPTARNVTTDAACNQTYVDTLMANLTAKINMALANQSGDSHTNSTKSDTVKFKTPSWCIPGNWFGWGIIPDPIACGGGNTYEGQTGTVTTVTGYGNVQLSGVKLTQTSCTLDPVGHTTVTSGTWTATATWPQVAFKKTDYWYPMVGGELGFGITMKINNIVINIAGTYGTNASIADSSACITAAACTSATVNVDNVDTTWGVPGAQVPSDKVDQKIEKKLESSATEAKIVAGINKQLASEIGKCKTVTIAR